MFCPHCGKESNGSTPLCSHCGASLQQPNQVAPQQPLPPQSNQAVPQQPLPSRPAAQQPHSSYQTPNPYLQQPNTAPNQVPPAVVPQSNAANTAIPANQVQLQVKPQQLAAFGTSLGIGIAAAFVFAIITALISSNAILEDVNTFNAPNFFQEFIFFLVAGMGGGYSFHPNPASDYMGNVSIQGSLPVSLVGLALVVGTAAGAYLLASKNRERFRWVGVISSLAVGIVSGLVVLILAAFVPLPIQSAGSMFSDSSNYGTLSGASFQTFALTFLLGTMGALCGYFLADKSPNSSNVFTAGWDYAHKARGPMRTIIESAAIFTAIFTLLGLIVFIVLAATASNVNAFALFPILFPLLPFALVEFSSFGGFTLSGVGAFSGLGNIGNATSTLSADSTFTIFNLSSLSPKAGVTWTLWVSFVVMLVSLFYIAMRYAARNIYDRSYADWRYSWQAPLFWILFWLFIPLLFGRTSISFNNIKATLMPTLWFCFVGGIWAFLVEVLARVLGPTIIVSAPGLWKCFVGGTVRVDPATATKPATQTTFVPQVSTNPHAGSTQPTTVIPTAAVPGASNFVQPPVQQTPAQQKPIQQFPAQQAPQQQYPAQQTPQQQYPAQQAPIQSTQAGTPAVALQRQRMSKAAKRGWIIAGVVAGVLVLCAIVFSVLNSTVFSMTSVAKTYMNAIQDGDFSKATQMAPVKAGKQSEALWTNKAAPKDEGSRMQNAHIVQERTEGEYKVVTFEYQIHGKHFNYDLYLYKDGTRAGIFPNWKIRYSMVSEVNVSYTHGVEKFTVNGVPVTASDSVDQTKVYAYPGLYTISVPKSKFLRGTSTELLVSPQTATDSADVQLKVTASDRLVEDINKKIEEKIDKCVTSKSMAPAGCPFRDYSWNPQNTRNYSWSVSEYPEVTDMDINLEEGTFYVYSGRMKCTYEYKGYNGWKPESSSTHVDPIRGTVNIVGDKVIINLETNRYN